MGNQYEKGEWVVYGKKTPYDRDNKADILYTSKSGRGAKMWSDKNTQKIFREGKYEVVGIKPKSKLGDE